jgi:hypothetical protein
MRLGTRGRTFRTSEAIKERAQIFSFECPCPGRKVRDSEESRMRTKEVI